MSSLEQKNQDNRQSEYTLNDLLSRQNYKKFAAAVTFCALFASLIAFYAGKKENNRANDLANFNKIYEVILSKGTQDESNIKKSMALMSKYKALSSLYQFKIAQHFLNQGEVNLAKRFLSLGYAKNKNQINYFERFSSNSINIEEKKFEIAFEEALLLKEDLLMDTAFWQGGDHVGHASYLFGLNLVRIGMLAKVLQKKEAELLAWREIKKYTDDKTSNLDFSFLDKKSLNRALDSFSEGVCNLNDFTQFREKVLTKQSI